MWFLVLIYSLSLLWFLVIVQVFIISAALVVNEVINCNVFKLSCMFSNGAEFWA